MKAPEKLGAEYYRGFLTWQGQAFYDGLNARLLREDYSGETAFPMDDPENAAADCFAAYKAIRDDHPEYFFLGLQSEFVRCGRRGILRYPILYRPDTIGRVREQMRRRISQIVRGTAFLRTIDRETMVYERIARKLTYVNHGDVRDHNIVGPVLLSSGVCEGHNALLLLCFRRIGIPCVKVYGKTKAGGWHCWTVAWIDGVPVHCDVTWDRPRDGIVRFDYLNLSDGQIGGDHFGFRGSQVPVCATEALSYYCHYGLCVESFRGLRSRLRADSSAGISPILLHFSYTPPAGDYTGELLRALAAERIGGSHTFYCHPGLKNFAVRTA